MKYDLENLPDWIGIDQRIVCAESVSALEKFIHQYEPLSRGETLIFRQAICDMLNEACAEKLITQEQIT